MAEEAIDVTPTWEALMPALVASAANGNVTAMNELKKLARIVDEHIARLAVLRDENKADDLRVCDDCGVRSQNGMAHAFGCPVASTQLTADDHVCQQCGSVNTTCDACASGHG
jgi:hypothetical protein